MKKTNLLLFVFTFLIYNISFSQNLTVGSKAPEIKIDEWVNKGNFTANDFIGKTLVIDFWFVECAPCVASIPHINKLADTYKNDKVFFLAITFDKKEKAEKFLEKMIMIPSVGTDTSLKTIQAFGVKYFPTTFVVGKDGLIKWVGSPFNLNESILHPVIKNQVYVKPDNYNPETGLQNTAYKIEIKVNNLEMGSSSYSHNNSKEIKIFNKTLKHIISEMLGVSQMRIDTGAKNFGKPLDVNLTIDDKYSTPENNRKIFLFLLQKELNIELQKTEKEEEVWVLSAKSDSLIHHYQRNDKVGASSNKKEWKGTGVSLDDLVNELEDEFQVIVFNETRLKEYYELKIPLGNFEEAKNILIHTYGLKLEKNKRRIEIVTIDCTKINLK
ncbi:MAG: TlpA disulfide reductase family protein [Bacteroidia bacterium]